jgi:hypothetical protein
MVVDPFNLTGEFGQNPLTSVDLNPYLPSGAKARDHFAALFGTTEVVP